MEKRGLNNVNIKRAAVCAAIVGLTTFYAPAQAEAEYVPNPTTILTNNAFTLGEPTTTKPTSGSYIVLSAIEKATNPWTVGNAYSTFTLNKTSYIYGDGAYTDLSTTINIPNSTQALTVKYTTSQNHTGITSLSENISNTVFASRSGSNGSAIKNTGSASYNITNSAFLSNNNSGSGHGGAVYNSGKMGNITDSEFISNYVSGNNCGGAIANASGAQMGDIKNNIFIGNNVRSGGDSGGAIINLANATIGDIENNIFISNNGCYAGGALFVSAGAKVNSIKSSVFISNIAEYGGVFGLKGNITEGISNSVFIANKTQVRTEYGGGVMFIYNNARVGDITNNIFISNSTVANGGVFCISNTQGYPAIASIQDSLFLNNNASKNGGVLYNQTEVTNGINNSTFISNIGSYGGVIYNNGTIGGIKNSIFLNNRATSSYGGAIYTTTALTISADSGKTTSFVGNTSNSQGGAIWSSANLTFNANNGTILFQNNTANSISNAIYFSGNRTANFNISNGGSVYMYDNINGTSGYNVVITNTGDSTSTGTFYMYNDMTNANVTTQTTGNTVTIDLSNDDTHNISMKTLTSDNTALYKIDFDGSTTPSADTITTTNASSGTVLINDINFYGLTGSETEGYTQTARVLNTPSNTLQLALSDALKTEHALAQTVVDTETVDIEPDWTYVPGQKIGIKNITTTYSGLFELATTSTTNDSIKMTVTDIDSSEGWTTTPDVLNAWVTQTTEDERFFRFTSVNDVYNLTQNLGTTSEGTLNIIGKYDAESGKYTKINAQNGENKYSVFNIANNSVLNISDVEITNAYKDGAGVVVNNMLGTVGLTNVKFHDNIATGSGGSVMNDTNGIMTISDSEFYGNQSGFDGGAIYNGNLLTISGNTSIHDNSATGNGGGIYVINQTTNISDTTFTNNAANLRSGVGGEGGAYYAMNATTIMDNVTFTNNTAVNFAGALANAGGTSTLSNVVFDSNTVSGMAGALYNVNGQTTITTGEFKSNTSSGAFGGGAIFNDGNNSNITINGTNNKFTDNIGTQGGAISNYGSKIDVSNAAFTGNISSTGDGGAIYNSGQYRLGILDVVNASFTSNSANGNGGAIYNSGQVDLTNVTFSGNSANALGGAIYSTTDILINSDAGTTLFQDNIANGESNAIYLDNASGILTFDIKNAGKTYMYDAIDGQSGYNVKITGADSTVDKMYLLNDIKNIGTVSVGGVELNTINDDIHTYNFNTLNLANNFNMAVDVDLANEVMDKIMATTVTGAGKINVVGFNLTSDMTEGKDNVSILFVGNNLKNSIAGTTIDLDNTHPYQTTAYSPIYKYTATYTAKDDGGYFNFARGGLNPSGGSGDFNPAVLDTTVAQQSTVLAVQNNTINYAFHHIDTCMTHGHAHLSSKYDNRYALADFVTNDMGTNNPLFKEQPDHGGVWVKPFVSFENVPLKNGPKVSTINYGTMIGYDSPHFHHKHGIEGIWTGYVGYNGASINYPGVDMTSNGGLIGATYSMYKGNFFNATTLTVGAMNDQAHTMYGYDNMATLYAGIGNKVGYNFDFKDELFIIQPSLLLSYTFANTFDYTNSAGVRINSDPVHSIQISPGIKFYMNTKNGWQPYIGVNMMWNVMDKSNVRANDVQLPSMSVKPYVQYGVGLQKVIEDNFSAYGQVMMQNGGRNGVSMTAGFRWNIGRDKNIEKVQKPITNKIKKSNKNNKNEEKHVLKS